MRFSDRFDHRHVTVHDAAYVTRVRLLDVIRVTREALFAALCREIWLPVSE